MTITVEYQGRLWTWHKASDIAPSHWRSDKGNVVGHYTQRRKHLDKFALATLATIPKKDLTWTDHRFFCTECERPNRAAQEMIDHDRDCYGPTDSDISDAEVVDVFHICLDCAGYGDEFNLTGEKVTA